MAGREINGGLLGMGAACCCVGGGISMRALEVVAPHGFPKTIASIMGGSAIFPDFSYMTWKARGGIV